MLNGVLLCEANGYRRNKNQMNTPGKKMQTRKETPPIKVYCLPEERALIEENAKQHGLSASSFLRNVGLGVKVSGVLDQDAIGELAKINADLGRLGGLLKMWLTNDERLALYNKAQLAQTIFGTLEKINTIQDVLLEKARSV